MEKIDDYQILKSLGKGGMGEVFLTYDPLCDREVALKIIRKELLRYPTIKRRFLREAQIAARLTHPSIIPIHAICKEADKTYYTMPYIEGETLKTILRTAREQEKQQLHPPIGTSIPTLARIFLSICQAIAYTHSKRILHRDIKPENIIVGKYGEVMLLDWGLADFIDDPLPENHEAIPSLGNHLTDPGKIVGTITYLAPERVLGEKASPLSDIYALGAILYQILTLHLPFKRSDLASYKKMMHREELIDPQEMAPYRDIPEQLAQITKKCLASDKTKRYHDVEELIAELKNYIEGEPEWLLVGSLDSHIKNHWKFQENIFLAKHIAITRETDVAEWVSLMISQDSFSGNTALETEVTLSDQSEGVGFLMAIPEAEERLVLQEGYCLWIGSATTPGCTLYRSNVEVLHIPDLFIHKATIRIEKTDHNLRFFLNGVLTLSYFSNIPLTGSHVGMLTRDDQFSLTPLKMYSRAQNVMVNCLAVPDAFLAHKNYPQALATYRRIGQCFRGRTEGWEALFRAGLTLIEAGDLGSALEEFEKLHHTAGAPLEYLGKSLVYKAEKDTDEEIKCLELALRKFAKHPLLSYIVEHIIFRLHEAAYKERIAAYHFALLTLRHLPSIFSNPDHQKLIDSLNKHTPPLPFLEKGPDTLLIALAFWLAKPLALLDMAIQKKENPLFVTNTLFALLKLGEHDLVTQHLPLFPPHTERQKTLECALLSPEEGLASFFSKPHSTLTFLEHRTLLHLFETALEQEKPSLPLLYFESLDQITLSDEQRLDYDILHIKALLEIHATEQAGRLFKHYPLELLTNEENPLFPLYGIFLWITEGEEIAQAHFQGVSEINFPPITALLAHFLIGKINWEKGWSTQAFYWEKRALIQQLMLFYKCTGQKESLTHLRVSLKPRF